MELEEVLNKNVSCQELYWSAIKETTLICVLNEIKGDKYFEITNYLRELYVKGDNKNYGENKKKLPVVTFCGTFSAKRKKEYLKQYNFIVVLDIDKLGDTELLRVKQELFEDEYVFSFWESPSRDGIKGLVYLRYKFDINENGVDFSHKMAFRQLVTYFKEKHNIELDLSGSDTTRLCFISCDRNLVLKKEILPFDVELMPFTIFASEGASINKTKSLKNIKSRDFLFNPSGKNNQFQRKTIKDIIKYLTKKSLSITNSYEEWLRIAFAISNSFTYDVGLVYFIELSRLDKEKFNEIECKNLLLNCYENSKGEISFNSIIHFASVKGFKYKNINAEST